MAVYMGFVSHGSAFKVGAVIKVQVLLFLQPQHQEIILAEDELPGELLTTPAPHLFPCKWQPHVQLLQSFICYHRRPKIGQDEADQTESDQGQEQQPAPIAAMINVEQQLIPETVKCMDYDEEKKMYVARINIH